MTVKEFKLPDLGEGLTEGEILQWLVEPGQQVVLNQPIVEVETAKAAVEIPSPYAGVVKDLMFEAGTTVDVGAVIIRIETDAAGPEEAPANGEDPDEGKTALLVGYGPKAVSATRRPRRQPSEPAPVDGPDLPLLPTIPDSLHSAVKPVRHGGLEIGRAFERATAAASAPVRAKPPVRKMARDLGVDLATVRATGPGGTVTRDDVQRAAKVATEPVQVVPPVARKADGPREERRPVKGVRKLTAEAMVASAYTAPHVTEWLTVDVTRTMELVDRLKAAPEFAELRVSPLLVVAKAVLAAIRRHPDVNGTFEGEEILVKHYVNLGIAAATPRGLVVPNIKDADAMSLVELCAALNKLVAVAKEGRTAPADMAGGSFTISNVGVFGVDGGTPIINPGEAAILAVGAVKLMPWVHDGEVKPRQVMQLSLSFDHRLVDGELGSLFLADIGRVLEDPSTLLLWS
ncbi:dihydrolipoamide acetyltransferase family protein [Fodinicola acaciae]|uniref:dihydrolipoamide acetyltransferase family protein n=1 Tax=Fodinicola acaciae TaxID=2681555 RepID=UPI0013D6D585|nr:dihydrolipoamide acetyltransferase family protein [Fodinicola acaciae]